MSAVTSIIRMVNFVVEGVQIAEKVSKASRVTGDGQLKFGYIAAAVTQATACCLNCTCAGADALGASTTTLVNIKGLECLARFADYVTSVTAAAGDAHVLRLTRGNVSASDYIKFFEIGFVAPVASAVRALGEGARYYERNFLEMSPEDMSKARRSVLENDVIVERPVIREECLKNVQELSSMIDHTQAVEMLTRIGPCAAAANYLEGLAERMEQRLR